MWPRNQILLLVLCCYCSFGTFNIGTQPDVPDVIVDGSATDDWSEQNDDVDDQEKIDWSSYIQLFAWTDEDEDVEISLTASVADNSVDGLEVEIGEQINTLSSQLDMTLSSKYIQSFMVYLECLKPNSGTYLVKIVEKKTETEAYFHKQCLSGVRADLSVTLQDGDEEVEVVTAGEVEQQWTSPDPTYTLERPDALFTELELVTEYGDQSLEEVTVTSSVPQVGLNVKGSAADGAVISEEEIDISVFYECNQYVGEVVVTMKLNIPPFDPVSFSWKKKCGAASKSVYIGTSIGNANIVNKDTTVQSDVQAKLHQQQAVYYIWSDSFIVFNEPILTFDHDIMRPEVYMESSGSYHVASTDPQRLVLRFNCIAKGEKKIDVTVPLENGKHLEFEVKKECTKPKIIRDTKTMTANKMIGLFAVVVALLGFLLYKVGMKKLN